MYFIDNSSQNQGEPRLRSTSRNGVGISTSAFSPVVDIVSINARASDDASLLCGDLLINLATAESQY